MTTDLRKHGTRLMRVLADSVSKGITTGHDWPNSQDELTRLQSARLLREAADEIESLRQRAERAEEDARRLADTGLILATYNDGKYVGIDAFGDAIPVETIDRAQFLEAGDADEREEAAGAAQHGITLYRVYLRAIAARTATGETP